MPASGGAVVTPPPKKPRGGRLRCSMWNVLPHKAFKVPRIRTIRSIGCVTPFLSKRCIKVGRGEGGCTEWGMGNGESEERSSENARDLISLFAFDTCKWLPCMLLRDIAARQVGLPGTTRSARDRIPPGVTFCGPAKAGPYIGGGVALTWRAMEHRMNLSAFLRGDLHVRTGAIH